MGKKRIKTRYLVAATAVILAVCTAGTVWALTHFAPGTIAEIYVDGEVVRTVDLRQSDSFNIETKYGLNSILIEDGQICVADADCPDKVCVDMGRRSDDAVPITCLPHHLVIRIKDAGDSVDAVAGAAP